MSETENLQMTNFLQVITPDDECSVHGREFMAKTRPVAPMWIDGVPHGEPVGHWVCVCCLMANTEREKMRANEAEAERDKFKGRVEELEKVLRDLLPGVERVTGRSVEAHLATGHWYLNVAGSVTIMQGDVCRDMRFGSRWTEEDIKLIEEEFNAPIRAVLDKSEEGEEAGQ